jgi:hypothetical protein
MILERRYKKESTIAFIPRSFASFVICVLLDGTRITNLNVYYLGLIRLCNPSRVNGWYWLSISPTILDALRARDEIKI